jgi:hypothetical protein
MVCHLSPYCTLHYAAEFAHFSPIITQGMNKMVINQHDKLFVTSDAATIIRELDVVHPAAKMVVMAANMQEQEVHILDRADGVAQIG